MKGIKVFLSALMILVSSAAFAQKVTVRGIVKDSDGAGVPFASVVEKGTANGVSTDAEGNYSISVAKNGTLVFSSVGFKNQEVAVAGKNTVNVALATDENLLNETVVVAYGTVKREAITGSVATVKADKLAEAPVTSVDKALGGKLAGVQVSGSSGQPGASSNIRIRGYSSINASNEPLWVVDGIPVVNGNVGEMTNSSTAIANLNPNDIESITVLKDAAAAAAYGSRAANGVILVTTKSGREGKAQFDARVKFGASWLQSDSGFRMMTAEELLGFQRDAIYNAGLDPDDPTGTFYRPMSLLNGEHSNWMNYLTRMGSLQEYEISARGGSQKAKYFSSLSYHKNEGTFYGIDYSKFQARVNADYKLSKTLETGARVNVAYTDQSDVPMQDLYYANPIWAGMTLLPWIPKTNADGTPNVEIASNSYQNPRATAMYDKQWEHNYRFNGTMYLRWSPIKNLSFETKNSAEGLFGTEKRYWDPGSKGGSSREPTTQDIKKQFVQLTTSNTATYANTFGGYHSLRAVVGQEAMHYAYDFIYTYAPGVNQQMPYPQTAPEEVQSAEMGFTRRSMLSFFGIADYSYDQKYNAQLTLRTDGSSLFGSKNKWGLFWSVSGSWNIARENFMKNVSWIDALKLRASYGVNGNNGIAAYQAYGTYGSSAYNGYVGLISGTPANDELSWEKNATWNIGLDFGFLNRIRGQVDVYSRKTLDMLLNKSVPATTGFTSLFRNTGSMKNQGVELQLEGDIFNTEDFFWNAGFNIAFNKTTILDLGGEEYLGSSMRQVVGKSMYTYYLYDYYGVNPANGEALWVADIDENGNKTLTNDQAKARKYYAGSPEPKFTGGFNTTINWKGLQLAAFFEFMGGNYVWNVNEYSYLNSDGEQMTMNQKASGLNYWKKPGDTACNPKPIAGNSTNSAEGISDRWLERGDFCRIKDITLSYNFQKPVLDALRLKGLKLYVSGLNLFCFNDVDYWDPAISLVGYGAGNYPITKSFVGGIEVTF